jgi:hypothetical protein
MPKNKQSQQEREPIGIVIWRGPVTEPAPRFSAYVYGDEEPVKPPVDVQAA